MARPTKGETPRKLNSIRLDDAEKKLLKEHFGGVQAAIDHLLDCLKKGTDPKIKSAPRD